MAVEEHGAGRQLIRFRSWPHHAFWVLVLLALVAAGAADAAIREARAACILLVLSAVSVGFPVVQQCGVAMATVDRVIRRFQTGQIDKIAERKILPPARAHLEQLR
jgi:hypothetical protein